LLEYQNIRKHGKTAGTASRYITAICRVVEAFEAAFKGREGVLLLFQAFKSF